MHFGVSWYRIIIAHAHEEVYRAHKRYCAHSPCMVEESTKEKSMKPPPHPRWFLFPAIRTFLFFKCLKNSIWRRRFSASSFVLYVPNFLSVFSESTTYFPLIFFTMILALEIKAYGVDTVTLSRGAWPARPTASPTKRFWRGTIRFGQVIEYVP